MSTSHHTGEVHCRCGGTFNIMDVQPTARYADCTMFLTPCCGRQADDRKWVSQPYTPLRRVFVDRCGGAWQP